VKETKFGTKVAWGWGWGWCPNFEYVHSAEKACDATLDDENASQHVTSMVVTALCNHPEAFTFDLDDDQSCYLFVLCSFVVVWFCLLVLAKWLVGMIIFMMTYSMSSWTLNATLSIYVVYWHCWVATFQRYC